METQQKSFLKFFEEMKACEKCALRTHCSQVVPGDGNENTDIMFIGEAPGQKEDDLGVPFVGAAGNLLSEMLGGINLKREDIYIANIIKCRPPGNRDPLPPEIKACTPWLVGQIKRIHPKLIITLGRYSMNFFLPQLKITQAHGHIYRVRPPFLDKKHVFFTLYHPAAALYNGGLRDTLFKDFAKIPRILEKIAEE